MNNILDRALTPVQRTDDMTYPPASDGAGHNRTRPLRLLDISQSYPSDDPRNIAGIHVHRQLIGLQERGWDIRVINPHPAFYRLYCRDARYHRLNASRDGIPIRRPRYGWLPFLMRHGSIPLDRSYDLAVRGAIRASGNDWKPDLVVGDWLLPGGLAAKHAAEHYGVPLVLKAHGHDTRWIAKSIATSPRHLEYYRSILDAAAYVVSNGQGLQNLILETGLIDERRAKQVPIGVDTERFRPHTDVEQQQARQALGLPADAQVWLFVGRWEHAKGSRELTQAAQHLLPGMPDTHLVAIGPIHDHADQQALEAEGFAERIHFCGSVNPDQVHAFMAAADVLILPSYAEGLPSTVLEAMASGLAVVATPVGGIPAVVEDGVNGFLVEVGDAPGLEAAVKRVAESADLRIATGQAARQTMLSDGYSLSAVADRLDEIFTAAVDRFAAQPAHGGNQPCCGA